MRQGMKLPVQDRQLVSRMAVRARAAKADAQRELHDVDVRFRPNEAGRGGAPARKLGQGLDGRTQMWSYERPAQPPAVLRIEVAGGENFSLHVHGLRTHVTLVAGGIHLDPGPSRDPRVRLPLPPPTRPAPPAGSRSARAPPA